MLQFRQTIDPHSLDIYSGPRFVGSLHWHPERAPRFCLACDYIDIDEMAEIVAKYKEIKLNSQSIFVRAVAKEPSGEPVYYVQRNTLDPNTSYFMKKDGTYITSRSLPLDVPGVTWKNKDAAIALASIAAELCKLTVVDQT